MAKIASLLLASALWFLINQHLTDGDASDEEEKEGSLLGDSKSKLDGDL